MLASAVNAGGSGAPSSALVQQTVQQAMSQGRLWTKENCSGIPSGGGNTVSLVTTAAGGMAAKWASTAIAAGASGPLAPIVLIAGGVLQVFGAIFSHHAAKVKQEQQIICAVVAACNDSFSVIDQAVQGGQISPDQGAQSLEKMYSDLQGNVAPILKQDSGHCNAACFILAEARGVIGKMKERYAAMPPPITEGMVIRSVSGPQVSKITGGMRRWIPDPVTFQCMGFNWPQVVTIPDAAWAAIPEGPAFPALTGPNCSASGLDAASSILPSGINNLITQAATSTGLPSWVIMGGGAILLLKLLKG